MSHFTSTLTYFTLKRASKYILGCNFNLQNTQCILLPCVKCNKNTLQLQTCYPVVTKYVKVIKHNQCTTASVSGTGQSPGADPGGCTKRVLPYFPKRKDF